jgi:hypothetical protein
MSCAFSRHLNTAFGRADFPGRFPGAVDVNEHSNLQTRRKSLTTYPMRKQDVFLVAGFVRIWSADRNASEFSRIRPLRSRAIRGLARSNLKKADPLPCSAFFLSAPGWRIGYSIH